MVPAGFHAQKRETLEETQAQTHPRLNGVAEPERHSMQTKPSIIAVDMDGTFLTDSKTFDTERLMKTCRASLKSFRG